VQFAAPPGRRKSRAGGIFPQPETPDAFNRIMLGWFQALKKVELLADRTAPP